MFMHRRRQAGGALEPTGQPAAEGPQGPIVLTLAMAGAGPGSSGPLSSMDGGGGGSGRPGQIMSSMND